MLSRGSNTKIREVFRFARPCAWDAVNALAFEVGCWYRSQDGEFLSEKQFCKDMTNTCKYYSECLVWSIASRIGVKHAYFWNWLLAEHDHADSRLDRWCNLGSWLRYATCLMYLSTFYQVHVGHLWFAHMGMVLRCWEKGYERRRNGGWPRRNSHGSCSPRQHFKQT